MQKDLCQSFEIPEPKSVNELYEELKARQAELAGGKATDATLEQHRQAFTEVDQREVQRLFGDQR